MIKKIKYAGNEAEHKINEIIDYLNSREQIVSPIRKDCKHLDDLNGKPCCIFHGEPEETECENCKDFEEK